MPSEEKSSESSESFAPGSLTFEHNPKAVLEESLLDFISRETGKMRSLSRSDLDSYLQFGHELINISKPFHLEGIGILQLNGKNKLEFIQSNDLLPQDPYRRTIAQTAPARPTLQAPDPAILRKWLIGIGLVVLLFLIVMAVRWMADRMADAPLQNQEKVEATNPTVPQDSLNPAPAVDKPATDAFGVVLEISKRQRALKRFADLKQWGINVRMVTDDSIQFKLYVLVNAPLSDTAHYRDSLSRYFGRKVWIETPPDEKP